MAFWIAFEFMTPLEVRLGIQKSSNDEAFLSFPYCEQKLCFVSFSWIERRYFRFLDADVPPLILNIVKAS